MTLKGDGESVSVAIWNTDGYAYAVDAQNHPLSDETIVKIISTIK